jgi:Asp-tRNA(Asn)/Glu-tRNA(Gln) amidotransferase C subunit
MARIRTIKPDFFSSEDITTLTPLSRLFYVSLWCESDKRGRFEYKPGTLKNRYFPADKADIPKLMDELLEAGLVRLYQPSGFPLLGWVVSFEKHQVINNRESESTFPPFSIDASATRESGVKAEGRKEGKEGKEGEGRKGSAREPKTTHGKFNHVLLTSSELESLKTDFTNSEDLITRLDEYIQMKGTKYLDHNLTIRNWVRRDAENKGKTKAPAFQSKTLQFDPSKPAVQEEAF